MRKVILSTVYGTIALILLIIVPYTLKFGGHGLSSNPSDWGTFGDYFGGFLNPILTFINLIFLAYLTYTINEVEERRNRNTIAELARPLGEFNVNFGPELLEIEFVNCGLGPLLITDFILTTNDRKFTTISEVISPLNPLHNEFFFHKPYAVLHKEMRMNLFKMTAVIGSQPDLELMNAVKSKINDLNIEIIYTDLYRTMNESASINLAGVKLQN